MTNDPHSNNPHERHVDVTSDPQSMNENERHPHVVCRGPFLNSGAPIPCEWGDEPGLSVTDMFENEDTRQSTLDTARAIGAYTHTPMPIAFADHPELRKAFEYGRGDAYGADY